MSRLPKPDAGIMAALIPFVILLLVLIALEPARAADRADWTLAGSPCSELTSARWSTSPAAPATVANGNASKDSEVLGRVDCDTP